MILLYFQAMEKEGVLEMYRRSVQLHNIFYDPFIGDGDSSTYQSVVKEAIYGPWKTVRKEECINHVAKRMGCRSRSIVSDFKGNSFYYVTPYLNLEVKDHEEDSIREQYFES